MSIGQIHDRVQLEELGFHLLLYWEDSESWALNAASLFKSAQAK